MNKEEKRIRRHQLYCQKYKEYNKKWNKRNPEKVKYSYYKKNARVKKNEWNLTFEEFMTFWQKPCNYCGSKIETIGLDRVDNKKGYNLDNVVSCCWICNRMKRASRKEDFIAHCKKVAEFSD